MDDRYQRREYSDPENASEKISIMLDVLHLFQLDCFGFFKKEKIFK
jgi:hypothetical protein